MLVGWMYYMSIMYYEGCFCNNFWLNPVAVFITIATTTTMASAAWRALSLFLFVRCLYIPAMSNYVALILSLATLSIQFMLNVIHTLYRFKWITDYIYRKKYNNSFLSFLFIFFFLNNYSLQLLAKQFFFSVSYMLFLSCDSTQFYVSLFVYTIIGHLHSSYRIPRVHLNRPME